MVNFINLRSGDITNDKEIRVLEEHLYSNLSFRKVLDSVKKEEITELLFNSEITDNLYDSIVKELSYRDFFTHNESILYFFVAIINHKHFHREIKLHIGNLSQAIALFKICNGNYTRLTLEVDGTPRFAKLTGRHRNLFPNGNLDWRIPVQLYKDGETNKNMVMLAGLNNPYAQVSIPCVGIYNFNIPRRVYMAFFKNNYTKDILCANNIQELLKYFDFSEDMEETIEYILTMVGLEHRKDLDFDLEDNMNVEFTDNGLIVASRHKLEDDNFIPLSNHNNSYRFLGNHIGYVPLKDKGRIKIFRK